MACVLCCVIASLSWGSQNFARGEDFSVMTWNLEWFYDEYDGDNFSKLAKEKSTPSRDQWNWRRDAVAASIAEVSPTVLGVQEVENRRVLWYLSRALEREHKQSYSELGIQSTDHYTEQDVGYLFRAPADALSISQHRQTRAMRASEDYLNVSKQLFGEFELPVGDSSEKILIVNVHLRARDEAEPLRKRQARLLHYWLADSIARGENVIVLGDFNTSQTGDQIEPGSDLAIVCGHETDTKKDDLYDLTLRVPRGERTTHLMGKQFDRILVSRSLIEDKPGTPDLTFRGIQVRPDLAIRGGKDTESEHWDNYWESPAAKRDLSDHYPVIATFTVR